LIQDKDTTYVAGVGDTIAEVDTRESLPNIAGKADIFGRTRPTGKIVITYLGLEEGRAVFERLNIRMQSNATTMNSSPMVIPQTSTTTYRKHDIQRDLFGWRATSSGSATTTAPPIVLPPSGSQTQVVSSAPIRYYLDFPNDRQLFIDKNVIMIEDATSSTVRYRIVGN
jgi:hypothetical protein